MLRRCGYSKTKNSSKTVIPTKITQPDPRERERGVQLLHHGTCKLCEKLRLIWNTAVGFGRSAV